MIAIGITNILSSYCISCASRNILKIIINLRNKCWLQILNAVYRLRILIYLIEQKYPNNTSQKLLYVYIIDILVQV